MVSRLSVCYWYLSPYMKYDSTLISLVSFFAILVMILRFVPIFQLFQSYSCFLSTKSRFTQQSRLSFTIQMHLNFNSKINRLSSCKNPKRWGFFIIPIGYEIYAPGGKWTQLNGYYLILVEHIQFYPCPLKEASRPGVLCQLMYKRDENTISKERKTSLAQFKYNDGARFYRWFSAFSYVVIHM